MKTFESEISLPWTKLFWMEALRQEVKSSKETQIIASMS